MTSRIIQGSPGWFFHVIVKGDDLIVRGALTTFFGGDNDPQDDGQTASGILTKGHPSLIGCALPVPDRGRCQATLGTPLPEIPWGTPVEFTSFDGLQTTAPLIDVGPSERTMHGADLTRQSFLDLGGDPDQGILSCDYRIIGGAKFIK